MRNGARILQAEGTSCTKLQSESLLFYFIYGIESGLVWWEHGVCVSEW